MSRAFGAQVTEAKRVTDWLRELTELTRKNTLLPADKIRMDVLKKYFGKIDFEPGSTELEKRVEKEIEVEILNKLRNIQSKRSDNN